MTSLSSDTACVFLPYLPRTPHLCLLRQFMKGYILSRQVQVLANFRLSHGFLQSK